MLSCDTGALFMELCCVVSPYYVCRLCDWKRCHTHTLSSRGGRTTEATSLELFTMHHDHSPSCNSGELWLAEYINKHGYK